MAFFLKQGDLLPSIQAQLLDTSGVPVDLTGVLGVNFCFRRRNNTNVTTAAATIVDATNGVVQYDWVAGDTDTVGEYEAEWVVTFASGKEQTFPSEGFNEFEVTEDLC